MGTLLWRRCVIGKIAEGKQKQTTSRTIGVQRVRIAARSLRKESQAFGHLCRRQLIEQIHNIADSGKLAFLFGNRRVFVMCKKPFKPVQTVEEPGTSTRGLRKFSDDGEQGLAKISLMQSMGSSSLLARLQRFRWTEGCEHIK